MAAVSVRDYKAAIEGALREFGIVSWRYDMTGKHYRCYYTLPGGRERFIVFPSTGSDRRGVLNSARDARRELRSQGLQPKEG